jgi:hypothetical protein
MTPFARPWAKNLLCLAGYTAVAFIVVLTQGCTSLAKQNIISSINTGIGVTLAENPQTQMYEVKAGYIRSQFYSIPTGKTYDEKNKTSAGDAEKAPQLIAGIRMHSGIDNLLVGMDVTESFAVGEIAVQSPAATVMYVSQAPTSGHAQAAASSITSMNEVSAAKITEQNSQADEIIQNVKDANGNVDPAKLDALVKGTKLEGKVAALGGKPVADLKAKLQGSWRPFIKGMHDNINH